MLNEKYLGGTLTVVIRDDSPMFHCGDCPSYRTVVLQLTDEQISALKLMESSRSGETIYYESISRAVLE